MQTKTLVILWMTMLCVPRVFAQAYVGQIEYRKMQAPAATVRLPYNTSLVENGLAAYMNIKGYKKSTQDLLVRARGDSDRIEKARLFLDSLAIFMDGYTTRLQVKNLEENKTRRKEQQDEIDKQQQGLAAVKARE